MLVYLQIPHCELLPASKLQASWRQRGARQACRERPHRRRPPRRQRGHLPACTPVTSVIKCPSVPSQVPQPHQCPLPAYHLQELAIGDALRLTRFILLPNQSHTVRILGSPPFDMYVNFIELALLCQTKHLSTQFTDTLSLPPSNHLNWPVSMEQFIPVWKSLDQVSRERANPDQKVSGCSTENLDKQVHN